MNLEFASGLFLCYTLRIIRLCNIYIFEGGGCMSESDISDIISINYFNLIRRCFYELQPQTAIQVVYGCTRVLQ